MTRTIRKAPLLAVVVVGLAVGFGLLLAGCGGDDAADLPEGVVAQVGDASITREELDRSIEQSRATAEQQGTSFPEEGSEGFDQVRRQAMETLVLQRVVEFEARKCGNPCNVTRKDIDEELDRIRETNFEGSQEQFDTFLEEAKITKADARNIVKNQLQQTKLFNHVTRGVRFSAKEAREYYDENAEQFRVAAGRTARHILVETEAEARRIRAQVTRQNFAELARRHSEDTGSAQQGGSLGAIQRGQLVPEFERVAFALKDGEISDPVRSQFGWHIITVDVTPARTTSFAEARSGIISSQLAQRRQDEFSAWRDRVLKEWEDRTTYADSSLRPSDEEPAEEQAPVETAP